MCIRDRAYTMVNGYLCSRSESTGMDCRVHIAQAVQVRVDLISFLTFGSLHSTCLLPRRRCLRALRCLSEIPKIKRNCIISRHERGDKKCTDATPLTNRHNRTALRNTVDPVSYTHLDVYKRQDRQCTNITFQPSMITLVVNLCRCV